MTTLVIVESPAKAKTIGSYLGKDYVVLASFGHVRDLPQRADQIPKELKKLKWSKLGVNVEGNFEPLYIVPEDKERHVANLRRALKDADQLLLATDEDREGESISWHIVDLLKPNKKLSVKRIVFHEITPEAIRKAVASPRDIDERLVRAQETRRILDRLYGYTLSPLLWKKVAPKLSAGRVQSVAVRVLVMRERERRSFKSSEYWDLLAKLRSQSDTSPFEAKLSHIDSVRVASGRHFNADTGLLEGNDAVLVDKARAHRLAELAQSQNAWTLSKLETVPGMEKPPVPFMTSTLQQEANRKLRFSAKRTMQIAQGLYEGVELGHGERVGLITYMRTDSLSLSDRCLDEARKVIGDLYGKEYLPATPARYRTKAKNAQEAHEAIRPTDLTRTPDSVRSSLDQDQYRLYELIWKRTIACQMVPAKVSRTTAQIDVSVNDNNKPVLLSFSASGKQITFPGFLRAYVEGADDPEAELGSQESLLPALTQGMKLVPSGVVPLEHHTKPPARYTEASLVKRLEEAGIGRPSTYASILSTVQERGYVFKQGSELVPTFTAFAVMEVLEKHFGALVDIEFTAKMEDQLDEIAEGSRDSVEHLRQFYIGDETKAGIVRQVEKEEPDIAYPAISVGQDEDGLPIVVRVGRYGTFVQRGEGGKENTVTLPEDMTPADLTTERALELLELKRRGPASVGKDPLTGREVFLRTGRFGSYLEVAQPEGADPEDKPRRASLPEDLAKAPITQEDVSLLLAFPRELGTQPETNEPVTVNLGRYGAYVRGGKETRNLPLWRDAAVLTFEGALLALAQPKMRRGRVQAEPKPPIKEFGLIEGAAGPVRILDGKYGAYVSDGKTNATLPKGADPLTLTPEEAMSYILARAGISKKPARGGRGGARKGGFGAKAETATKAPAKKTPAKKTAVKKAATNAASDDADDGVAVVSKPAAKKAATKSATGTVAKKTVAKKAAPKKASTLEAT